MGGRGNFRRGRGLAGALSAALVLSLVAVGSAAAHPSEDKLQRDSHGGGVGAVVDDEKVGFVSAVPWDGTATPDGQTGELVYAGAGCTPASYAGVDADGRIVVVEQSRSDGGSDPCPVATFAQRMALAEAAGAVGLLHLRNEGSAPGGNAISSGIPGLDVAFDDAVALRELVVGGGTAQATLVEPASMIPDERVRNAACEDGEAAGVWDCDGIDLLSFVPLSEFEGDVDARAALGAGASDLWGWTDEASGDEYVIIGTTTGVAFFRVTDPTDPQFLGRMENPAALQLIWHDIKVYEDHAFVVSESNPHGMRVVDLTELRDVGPDDEPTSFEPVATYPLAAAAHNIELNVDSGFAYIVGGNAALVVPDQCRHGLHIVNVNEPANPTFAGCYAAEGGPGTGPRVVGADDVSPFAYVHDAQCVIYDGPDQRFQEREICFNSAEDKIVIADVTDKLLPETLGVVEYPMTGYAHQGWLTQDQDFLLVNDEADETSFGIDTRTVVIDVTDLTDPQFHFGHSHDTRSITHNNYTVGDLVFQSNYTSGLRVLDVANVADVPEAVKGSAEVKEADGSPLTEVAFFDTFPAHGDATFDGTWSNYPFFESGTIAVSGIDEGLFLLQLQEGVVEEEELDGPKRRRGIPEDCVRCPDEVPPPRGNGPEGRPGGGPGGR